MQHTTVFSHTGDQDTVSSTSDESVPPQPMLDLNHAARKRTWLLYRISKKRLLANVVMPIKEVRYDSR